MPLAAQHPCSACLAQTAYSGPLPTLHSCFLAATKGQLSSAASSGDFSITKLSSRGQSRMAEGHSLSSHLWLSYAHFPSWGHSSEGHSSLSALTSPSAPSSPVQGREPGWALDLGRGPGIKLTRQAWEATVHPWPKATAMCLTVIKTQNRTEAPCCHARHSDI